MSTEGAIITGIVSVIVAVLAYMGVRDQTRTAKAGSDSTNQTAERAQVVEEWKALLAPYREEVGTLRHEVEALRDEATQSRDREAERDRKIDTLTAELHRWQRVAKTIARWAVTMRDQLRGMGAEVPAEPDELMTLRIVSDVDDDNPL